MDRNERETSDFTSVQSFSELPFIRPAPPGKEKGSGSTIRLFGKDFGGTTDDKSENTTAEEGETSKNSSSKNADMRRFECHYCCRNFPTSQALGGHQNAHKRERQNAKRAHHQSVMVHDYGRMNYGHLTSALPLPRPFHSWRPLGSHSSYNADQPLPINGSPLGLWRIPPSQNPSPFPRMPLMTSMNKQLKPAMQDNVSLDLHL